jgi:hypothetical protein
MAMIAAGIATVAAAGIATAAAAGTASVTAAGTASGRFPVTFGPGPAVCEPFQAHTLASDRAAVVYSLDGEAYGCSRPTGPTYKFGLVKLCIGATRVGPFALAGDVVAYGSETCGVDFSASQAVSRSLESGHVLRREPATSRTLVEQEGGLQSIVVKPDGSIAWIATEQSLGNHRRLLQVRRDDRGGDTLLSSSPTVLPSSLKLHRSRLTWRDAGKLRSATLR